VGFSSSERDFGLASLLTAETRRRGVFESFTQRLCASAVNSSRGVNLGNKFKTDLERPTDTAHYKLYKSNVQNHVNLANGIVGILPAIRRDFHASWYTQFMASEFANECAAE
jgi:hypothetical protein